LIFFHYYLLIAICIFGYFQIQEKSRAFPLVINGFRANPKDAEGHILFFDVEALITQMLTEEYSQMSPGTMEVQGFTNQVSGDGTQENLMSSFFLTLEVG